LLAFIFIYSILLVVLNIGSSSSYFSFFREFVVGENK